MNINIYTYIYIIHKWKNAYTRNHIEKKIKKTKINKKKKRETEKGREKNRNGTIRGAGCREKLTIQVST